MSIQGKNHHASDKTTAMVSQASRSMASGPKAPHFESYQEEFNYLIKRKREIETLLSKDYSKAAFSAAQAKVRNRQFGMQGGSTLNKWLQIRNQMGQEKAALVEEKCDVENRIQQIRPHVKDESIEQNKRVDYGELLIEISEELREVRVLLKKIADRIAKE